MFSVHFLSVSFVYAQAVSCNIIHTKAQETMRLYSLTDGDYNQ
jgi:hypothetical protein